MSLESAIAKLESAVSRIESSLGVGTSGDDSTGNPPAVAAFDELVDGSFKQFIDACNNIGEDLTKISQIVQICISENRRVIKAACSCSKPSDEELLAWVQPLASALTTTGALPDNRNKFFNHQSAFVELSSAFQWFFISPAPRAHVQGAKDSADFYLNKCLMNFKDDPAKEHHRNFVKFGKLFCDELMEYIKRFHTTGLSWRSSGVALDKFEEGSPSDKIPPTNSAGNPEDRLMALADRLESLSLAGLGSMNKTANDLDDVPASLADFDQLVSDTVSPFVQICKKIGGDVSKLGEFEEEGFKKLRWFILASAKCKKPTDEVLGSKFADIADVIKAAMSTPDNRNKVFSHQQSFSEHIQCLQWILVSPAPKPFVQGTLESADFYLNKVLTGFKEDPNKADHRAFVKGIKDITAQLGDYIKKYHATGLSWNSNGQDFETFE